MITENYTPRIRKAQDFLSSTDQRVASLEYRLEVLSQNNTELRQERTIMAARLQHLELMLTDKDHRKKFKKANKA